VRVRCLFGAHRWRPTNATVAPPPSWRGLPTFRFKICRYCGRLDYDMDWPADSAEMGGWW